MAVKKIKNAVEKSKKRIKFLEKNNPEMAERAKGKLASMKGKYKFKD